MKTTVLPRRRRIFNFCLFPIKLKLNPWDVFPIPNESFHDNTKNLSPLMQTTKVFLNSLSDASLRADGLEHVFIIILCFFNEDFS